MTKFLAAAYAPDPLLVRRGRQEHDRHDPDHEPVRPDAGKRDVKPDGAAAGLDLDMLDLITRFEQNYAELAPAREEPQLGSVDDDLFPAFPEPFEDSPPRTRTRTLELARFEPQGSRAAPAAHPQRVESWAAAGDEQAEIDEAFSILKAAEAKGAAKAQRAADDAQALAAERHVPAADVARELKPERNTESIAEVERTDWAARSHRPRTIALAGGVLVLALGLTAGFIAGRAPHGKPQATIQTTEQGGTLLRLDPVLRKR